jgi:anthranilate phosphoribosyltransferase
MIKEAIEAIVNDERDLTEEEATAAMEDILTGEGKHLLKNFLEM